MTIKLLSYKQQRQILAFFTSAHGSIHIPPASEDFQRSGVIALFRACRDYCNGVAGNYGYHGNGASPIGKGVSPEVKEKYRRELIERLDKLAIRYYERF